MAISERIGAEHEETTMTALAATTMTNLTIRPFRINVPEEELVELRRRIAAARLPERESVDDQS
jgi:hypothetical protein